MGKLKELWQQLSTCPPEKKPEIQKKINDIEGWMIENNYGSIKQKTDWNKPGKKKICGDKLATPLNPPFSARYGKDRCQACTYNKANYCDPLDKYSHQLKV